MGPFCFYHEKTWITEGAPFYFSTTLRDEKGALIGSTTLATCTLTLYDMMSTPPAIVNAVDHVDIKNVSGGRGAITSQGLLEVTLAHQAVTSGDTAILDDTHSYERRRMLIEFTRTTSGKADCLEVLFVVRNVVGRPPPP